MIDDRRTATYKFVKMVSSHSSLIYKVCNAYATGSYEMNDLYQDILLNLWRSYPSFRRREQIINMDLPGVFAYCGLLIEKRDQASLNIQLTSELENI